MTPGQQQVRQIIQFQKAAGKISDKKLSELTGDEILTLVNAVSEKEELIRWLLSPLEPKEMETMEGGDFIPVQPGFLTVAHSVFQGRHLERKVTPSNSIVFNQFMEGYR